MTSRVGEMLAWVAGAEAAAGEPAACATGLAKRTQFVICRVFGSCLMTWAACGALALCEGVEPATGKLAAWATGFAKRTQFAVSQIW